MQAAILSVKLRYVEEWNEARRQRAATYDRLFAEAGMTSISEHTENSAPIQVPYCAAQGRMYFISTSLRAYRRDEVARVPDGAQDWD